MARTFAYGHPLYDFVPDFIRYTEDGGVQTAVIRISDSRVDSHYITRQVKALRAVLQEQQDGDTKVVPGMEYDEVNENYWFTVTVTQTGTPSGALQQQLEDILVPQYKKSLRVDLRVERCGDYVAALVMTAADGNSQKLLDTYAPLVDGGHPRFTVTIDGGTVTFSFMPMPTYTSLKDVVYVAGDWTVPRVYLDAATVS